VKVLVVAPNWIGDGLMAQPLLRRLLLTCPDARLTVLARQHVAPIFHYMPEVGEVLVAPFSRYKLLWKEQYQLLRQQLQAQAFDRAYVLPNSFKSALLPWLAGIPVRIGYLGEMRLGLLNQRLPNPNKQQPRPPMAEFYAALAGTPAHGDYFNSERPRLTLPETEVQVARQHFLGNESATPLIGFCPGAEYGDAKRYPSEQFAALARLFIEQHPQGKIVCLGGPKDHEIAQKIVQHSGLSSTHIVNLCGQTQLQEALALMKNLQAVVSNDSGLMHVAAALDVPLVAVYGSTDPHHTPPYSPTAKIATLALDCSPCFARECPLGHFRCMRDLSPERVYALLEPLLLKTSSPQHA
jgi:heptosyltransferase-2